MPENKKIALFSIEIAARELLPKCLLALETAKRGFRVYIGSFRAMKQLKGKTSSCIFFHKSSWERNAKRIINELGATFVFLDEEMGISQPRSDIKMDFASRFRNVTPEKYSDIFVLGDTHKREMETLPNMRGVNIHATGWPRLDLWRDEFQQVSSLEAKIIKKQFGDFYLLVSSFGAISESSRYEFIKIREESNLTDHKIVDFKYNEFKSCLKLIHELSQKLQRSEKIIIRPHTSESIDQWIRYIAKYKNVSVCHEGDAAAWLLAARGTIQYGSTLAVQAAYMGVPSVQHTFTPLEGATDTPSYEVLHQAKSADEMLCYLRSQSQMAPELLRDKAVERLSDLVANLDGKLSAEAIAERLAEIDVSAQPPIHFNLVERCLLSFKEQINYLNYLKKKKFGNESGRVKRSKFEKIPKGLTKEEIEHIIRNLAEILGDDLSKIKCRQAAHNLVEIEFD